MTGPNTQQERDDAEDWQMENDPYSDEEKENIGDNGEGNDSDD